MNNYAHPEALVETDWLAEHLNDPSLRIVESNEDILLYDTGHIAGAVHIDWRRDLQHQVQRDYINPAQFAQLAGRNGIGKDTTVVFYGDKANWWAAYALWSFRLFGHENVKLLNGGRMKWIAEGRPLTREIPRYPNREYPNPVARDDSGIRAFKEDVLARDSEAATLPVLQAGEGRDTKDARRLPRGVSELWCYRAEAGERRGGVKGVEW